MIECIGVKTLPDDGSGLQRSLVLGFEPIHPGQHQALDGIRQARGGALLRGAQQLLEKQRVSGSALQATRRQRIGGIDEPGDERDGVLLSERAQVDSDERAALGAAAPFLVELIALYARRHHQQGRTLSHRLGEVGQVRQGDGVAPVDVLNDDENRPGIAGHG